MPDSQIRRKKIRLIVFACFFILTSVIFFFTGFSFTELFGSDRVWNPQSPLDWIRGVNLIVSLWALVFLLVEGDNLTVNARKKAEMNKNGFVEHSVLIKGFSRPRTPARLTYKDVSGGGLEYISYIFTIFGIVYLLRYLYLGGLFAVSLLRK